MELDFLHKFIHYSSEAEPFYHDLIHNSVGTWLIILPILYLVMFLIFTLLKTINSRLDKIIFCSVCFSYAFVLIFIVLLGITPIITTYALGLSIVGLSYRISYKVSEPRSGLLNFFIVMLFFTIIGEILIYNFLI